MGYPCGAADFAQNLSKELSNNLDVTVLTANTRAVKSGAVSVKIVEGPWNIWKVYKIATWIKKENFDYIDIQFEAYMYGSLGSILLLPFLLPKKCKKILTLHSEALPKKGGRLWRAIQMFFFDQIIFYSEQFLNNAEKRFQKEKNKFSLAPFPSNISKVSISPLMKMIKQHQKGLDPNTIYLSFFGHLSPGRHIEDLLQLMFLLKNKNFHLIFIGQFDPAKNVYHREIQQMYKSMELEDSITFTGRLEESEVSQMIQLTDIGLLPFSEGASFKNGSLAAYVSHQIPVFTTKSELTEKNLLDSKGLYFFSIQNLPELKNELLDIKINPKKLLFMKDEIQKLDQLYSWQNYREQRLSIYNRTTT